MNDWLNNIEFIHFVVNEFYFDTDWGDEEKLQQVFSISEEFEAAKRYFNSGAGLIATL